MCKKKAVETDNFLHRDPIGEPGGVFVNQGHWDTVKECSLNGTCLSIGAVWGELGGSASLLGTLKASSYQYPETGSETDFGL
jgi:hypothetical protein